MMATWPPLGSTPGMQAFGIGVDVCAIARIERSLHRYGAHFASKFLTAAEWAYCVQQRHPAPSVAARFAAKEAALKALGVPKGVSFQNIEVERRADGAPVLCFTGVAAATLAQAGSTQAQVSLSHDGGVAIAFVLITVLQGAAAASGAR